MFILSCNGVQVNVFDPEIVNYTAQSMVEYFGSPCTVDQYENYENGAKPVHNFVGAFTPTIH